MNRTVDYTALTAPVSPAEVTAFRARMRSRPEYSTTSAVVVVIALVVAFFVFGVFFLGILGSFVSFAMSLADDPGAAIGTLVVPLLLMAGFVVIAVVAIRAAVRGGRWERWYRLDAFASANGMVFSPRDADPQYPGAVFQIGRAKAAVDHLRSASDRFLDYGNYR